MTRPRDYAYEALAEATSTDIDAGRGELNIALKTIRAQSEIQDSYLLAAEIHERAKAYRKVMGDEIMLTPTALAKHWKRVAEESARPVARTNVHAPPSECPTCKGDRFVLVLMRPATASIWTHEHGLEPVTGANFEEWAPCPDCNSVDTSFTRFDGSKVRTPDPGKVREWLRG